MCRTTSVVIAGTLSAMILSPSPPASGAPPSAEEKPAPAETVLSETVAPTFRLAVPGTAAGPTRPGLQNFPYPSAQANEYRVLPRRVQPVPGVRIGVCLAADPELCEFGAFVTRSRPCLAAGDCPAYEAWERVMGSPGPRPAPESTIRAAGLTKEPARPRD